jgi:Uma2 family endonuclease
MKQPSKTANGPITVREFYHLVADGQKADLIDGVIYIASPDKPDASDLTGFVDFLVRGYNDARRLGGRVFVSRAAFRLSRFRAPEPDVAFVRKGRRHLIAKREIKGGPDAAVEIVSHDSRQRDYVDKKRIYQAAGVTEYWIIDAMKKRVEFHKRHAPAGSLEGRPHLPLESPAGLLARCELAAGGPVAQRL